MFPPPSANVLLKSKLIVTRCELPLCVISRAILFRMNHSVRVQQQFSSMATSPLTVSRRNKSSNTGNGKGGSDKDLSKKEMDKDLSKKMAMFQKSLNMNLFKNNAPITAQSTSPIISLYSTKNFRTKDIENKSIKKGKVRTKKETPASGPKAPKKYMVKVKSETSNWTKLNSTYKGHSNESNYMSMGRYTKSIQNSVKDLGAILSQYKINAKTSATRLYKRNEPVDAKPTRVNQAKSSVKDLSSKMTALFQQYDSRPVVRVSLTRFQGGAQNTAQYFNGKLHTVYQSYDRTKGNLKVTTKTSAVKLGNKLNSTRDNLMLYKMETKETAVKLGNKVNSAYKGINDNMGRIQFVTQNSARGLVSKMNSVYHNYDSKPIKVTLMRMQSGTQTTAQYLGNQLNRAYQSYNHELFMRSLMAYRLSTQKSAMKLGSRMNSTYKSYSKYSLGAGVGRITNGAQKFAAGAKDLSSKMNSAYQSFDQGPLKNNVTHYKNHVQGRVIKIGNNLKLVASHKDKIILPMKKSVENTTTAVSNKVSSIYQNYDHVLTKKNLARYANSAPNLAKNVGAKLNSVYQNYDHEITRKHLTKYTKTAKTSVTQIGGKLKTAKTSATEIGGKLNSNLAHYAKGAQTSATHMGGKLKTAKTSATEIGGKLNSNLAHYAKGAQTSATDLTAKLNSIYQNYDTEPAKKNLARYAKGAQTSATDLAANLNSRYQNYDTEPAKKNLARLQSATQDTAGKVVAVLKQSATVQSMQKGMDGYKSQAQLKAKDVGNQLDSTYKKYSNESMQESYHRAQIMTMLAGSRLNSVYTVYSNEPFEDTVARYKAGARVELNDLQTYIKILAHKKRGENVEELVSYSDLLANNRFKRNGSKTLSLFLFPFIPSVGFYMLALPLITPRVMLSENVWSDNQKKVYLKHNHYIRRESFKEVFNHMHRHYVFSDYMDPKESDVVGKISQTLNNNDGYLTGGEMQTYKQVCKQHPFNLQSADKMTLHYLCRIHAISIIGSEDMLLARLANTTADILQMDSMLRDMDLNQLSDEELSATTFLRGLDVVNLSNGAKLFWLQNWLKITEDCDQSNASFILQAAMIQAMNFDEPMYQSISAQAGYYF